MKDYSIEYYIDNGDGQSMKLSALNEKDTKERKKYGSTCA